MMGSRILILGATGMLGHRLFAELSRYHEVGGTVRGEADGLDAHPAFCGARVFGGVSANVPDSITRVLDAFRPDVIINCIGVVKQRPEGSDPIEALIVNGVFPHRLAAAANERAIRLIHLSTDCVFSGKLGRSYRESDVPDADDVYGRSKLVGEVSGPNALTLRTSMIGWELSHATGLLEWAAGQAGRSIRGYRGALFSGFTTDRLATLIGFLIAERPGLSGLWHAAAEGIDKFDLLTRLDRALGWRLSIEPVNEPRIDRRLNGSRLWEEIKLAPPQWDDMIEALRRVPRYPRIN